MFKKTLAYLIIIAIFYSDFNYVYSMYPDQPDGRSPSVHQKIDLNQEVPLSSPAPTQNNQQRQRPTLPLVELPLTEPIRPPETPVPLTPLPSVDKSQNSNSPPSPEGSHRVSPGHSSPELSTSSSSPRSGPDTEQEDQGLEERVQSPSSSPELQELVQINPVPVLVKEASLSSQITENKIGAPLPILDKLADAASQVSVSTPVLPVSPQISITENEKAQVPLPLMPKINTPITGQGSVTEPPAKAEENSTPQNNGVALAQIPEATLGAPTPPVHEERITQAISSTLPSQCTQNTTENPSNTSSPIKPEQKILLVENKGERGKGEKLNEDEKGKNGSHSISPSIKQPGEKTPLLGEKKSASQAKLKECEDEESLLISSGSPAITSQKQSFISAIVESITEYVKSKTGTKKDSPIIPVVDSSSPLLPNDQDDSDSDAIDGTSSGKDLGQSNHSINHQPDQGSSKELDELSVKSWVIVDLYKNRTTDKQGGAKHPSNGGQDKGDEPRNEKDLHTITVTDDLTNLDPRVKAFLLYAKNHINDGKITLSQGLISGIGGAVIGFGVGNGMDPILSNGFRKIGGKFFYEIYDDDTWANVFSVHTTLTLGIDSMARNVMFLGDMTGPSLEAFSISPYKIKVWKITINPRKTALACTYMGAGIAAFLPVYYLWFLEKRGADLDPDNKLDYMKFFWSCAPALFLDSLLTTGKAATEWVDDTFNARLICQAFSSEHHLIARILRDTELNRFKKLAQFFRYTPDDEIHDLYEQVLVHGFNIKENGTHIPEEQIKAKDALQTLQVLRKIHSEKLTLAESEEDWRKIVANFFGRLIPDIAIVGRSLTFFLIIFDLLNDLNPTNHLLNQGLAIVFGEMIASFYQGKVEVDATKEAVYDLLGGEDTEGDSSHNRCWKGLRRTGKTYNYLQGAWNTLPYILIGIQATRDFSMGWQVFFLLFFGLADMFNNTVAFHKSYGGTVSGAESLLSYKYATAGYKRNKLIRLVRRYEKAYETMHPEVMLNIDVLLSKNKENIFE